MTWLWIYKAGKHRKYIIKIVDIMNVNSSLMSNCSNERPHFKIINAKSKLTQEQIKD